MMRTYSIHIEFAIGKHLLQLLLLKFRIESSAINSSQKYFKNIWRGGAGSPFAFYPHQNTLTGRRQFATPQIFLKIFPAGDRNIFSN